jgi:hypothetical protein
LPHLAQQRDADDEQRVVGERGEELRGDEGMESRGHVGQPVRGEYAKAP